MLGELIEDVKKDTARRVTITNGLPNYFHLDAQEIYTDAESMWGGRIKAAMVIDEACRVIASQRDPFAVCGFVQDDQVDRLFDVVKKLARTGRVRDAIQKIFTTMNSWLCEGRFDLCREALEDVDPGQLGADLSLSFLTITFAAKQHLNPYRADLLNDLRQYITKSSGLRVAENVLRNLQ